VARRHNFFDFPHKPFRHMWMDLVSSIGCVNYTDDRALEELAGKVQFATDVYAHHNRDESEWFGPRLQELDSELTSRWLADHEEHLHTLTDLRDDIHAIREEKDLTKRGELTAAFYDKACAYLAGDLDHMISEQTEVMKAFQDRYDDDELREMEARFLQERIDPAYLQRLTPLFLRAGNLDERTFLLSIAQQQAPSPEAFQGLLGDLVASIVPPNELVEIRRRLGA